MSSDSTLQRICSENMSRLRADKGLSQAQMAERIGITQPSYWALENAKSSVTLSMLERIATVLAVPPNQLLLAVGSNQKSTATIKELA